MNRAIRVLLLGENDASLDYLREFLETRGCHCCFAKSPAESIETYGPCCFDLILDTLPGRGHPSLAGLGTSNCDIFRSYCVENSCWWLPIVSAGIECSGAPGLRPREFARKLGETLAEREWPKAFAALA